MTQCKACEEKDAEISRLRIAVETAENLKADAEQRENQLREELENIRGKLGELKKLICALGMILPKRCINCGGCTVCL